MPLSISSREPSQEIWPVADVVDANSIRLTHAPHWTSDPLGTTALPLSIKVNTAFGRMANLTLNRSAHILPFHASYRSRRSHAGLAQLLLARGFTTNRRTTVAERE